MRILLAHNYYRQPGGEDVSFAAESALLSAYGHEVVEYTQHNDTIVGSNLMGVAARSVWNDTTYRELRRLIRRVRPDVTHFTNTFPLISPSAYYASRAEGVPVVQALRNYRLLCPSGVLFRAGRVCHECIGKRVPWPGVVHRCYRDSRAATAAVAAMLSVHHAVHTWQNAVDLYVTPTEFSRRQFVAAGLPDDKIEVKSNFLIRDPGPGCGVGGYAVFVGRLSREKGLRTLLTAWESLHTEVPLKIVGDGPEAPMVRRAVAACRGIEWLGRRGGEEVQALIGDAAFLVFPSEWYETFGRVVMEAFAVGTPVVASRLGAASELVDDGRTGLCYEPRNAADLVCKVRELLRDSARLLAMRREARREFEARYTADRNYEMLMTIYARAIDARAIDARRSRGGAPAKPAVDGAERA